MAETSVIGNNGVLNFSYIGDTTEQVVINLSFKGDIAETEMVEALKNQLKPLAENAEKIIATESGKTDFAQKYFEVHTGKKTADITGFEKYLQTTKNKNGDDYTGNSISTRLSHLRKVDDFLNGVDNYLNSERSMYIALLALRRIDSENQPLQNALRLYWKFKKNTDFPTIEEYERTYKTDDLTDEHVGRYFETTK